MAGHWGFLGEAKYPGYFRCPSMKFGVHQIDCVPIRILSARPAPWCQPIPIHFISLPHGAGSAIVYHLDTEGWVGDWLETMPICFWGMEGYRCMTIESMCTLWWSSSAWRIHDWIHRATTKLCMRHRGGHGVFLARRTNLNVLDALRWSLESIAHLPILILSAWCAPDVSRFPPTSFPFFMVPELRSVYH